MQTRPTALQAERPTLKKYPVLWRRKYDFVETLTSASAKRGALLKELNKTHLVIEKEVHALANDPKPARYDRRIPS